MSSMWRVCWIGSRPSGDRAVEFGAICRACGSCYSYAPSSPSVASSLDAVARLRQSSGYSFADMLPS